MKHFAIPLFFVSSFAFGGEVPPLVATESAYIQILEKLDGMQPDLVVNGIDDLGRSMWDLAEQGDHSLVSDWIESGLSPENLISRLHCLDAPGDFTVESHQDFWRFRDSRELVCVAGSTAFSVEIEVTVSRADEVVWEGTSLQSIMAIK